MRLQMGKIVARKQLVLAMMGVLLCQGAIGATDQQKNYKIAAGQLGKTISSFAAQSGVALSFDPELTTGLISEGLQGNYTPEQGIQKLLEGTDLKLLKRSENNWTLIRSTAETRNSDQAPSAEPLRSDTLPKITLVANKDTQIRKPDQIVQRKSKGSALFGDANIREIPFTVNVVTDVEIENRMAKTIGEVLAGDPAVRNDYGASGGYPTESFNIRGFQIGGGSAFLKDGMPMTGQVNQGTENLEQVEVVRGPMGFRYGFLPPGGAINMVSKKPTRQPYHSFTLTTDEYGSAKGHLDVGDRAGENDQFGYRINVVGEANKNFVKPITKDRNLFSAAFDYRVGDHTTLTLNYDRNDYKSGPDIFHYTVPDINGQEIKGIKPDGYWGQKWMPDNTFLTQTASFGIESQLTNNLKLYSTTGIYNAHRESAISLATNAKPNGDFNINTSFGEYKHNVLSNTTYLNLDVETGPVRHDISAGVAYAKDVFDRRNVYGSTLGYKDANGVLVPFVNNFFDPKQFPNTLTPVITNYTKASEQEKQGAFLSDMLHYDNWHFLLAARYSKFENKINGVKNSSIDPTVGLTYDINAAASIYGSYATGLEPGGVAPAGTTNFGTQFDPQKSSQEEIGAKIDLNGKKLVLDTALFRIEKAAEFTKTFANGSKTYVQSGRQIHRGLEVRLQGKLGSDLTVNTGIQYLDAKLTGNPATVDSRPMNVPKINATFSGDYKLPFFDGLTLTTGLYYTGKREINVPNLPATAAAYTRWDVGARYETQLYGQDVIGRLNIENITNKTYYSSGWYSLYEYGAPRTVSASVQVKF